MAGGKPESGLQTILNKSHTFTQTFSWQLFLPGFFLPEQDPKLPYSRNNVSKRFLFGQNGRKLDPFMAGIFQRGTRFVIMYAEQKT